jgi:hypothetical protein
VVPVFYNKEKGDKEPLKKELYLLLFSLKITNHFIAR